MAATKDQGNSGGKDQDTPRIDVHAPIVDELATLEQKLAAGLKGMKPGQCLVLQVADLLEPTPAVPNYYVSITREEQEVVGEAVSDRYLSEPWRLSEEAHRRMTALGWLRPGEQADSHGRFNFGQRWESTSPCQKIAAVVVATLRHVYGVGSVEQLAYRHFDKDGQDDMLPDLGPRYEREHCLNTVDLGGGPITRARAYFEPDGELVVTQGIRDGMFSSLHDMWRIAPAARDEVLLRLIEAKFSTGDLFANWLGSVGVPFRHVSDYTGGQLKRP